MVGHSTLLDMRFQGLALRFVKEKAHDWRGQFVGWSCTSILLHIENVFVENAGIRHEFDRQAHRPQVGLGLTHRHARVGLQKYLHFQNLDIQADHVLL